MRVKQFVQSGVAGVATSAVIALCISSLGLMSPSDLLFGLIFSVFLSAVWGTTAGLLTYYVWRRNSPVISYLLGAGGFFIGFLGFSSFVSASNLQERLHLSLVAWGFVFVINLLIVGILVQLLLLLLLVALRQLLRMTRHISVR